MATDSYWNKVLQARSSRRKVVVGGASLAGAAALLAACGGDDSGESGGQQESTSRVLTDKAAEGPVKPGGTYNQAITSTPVSIDPFRQSTAGPSSQIGTYAMNRVVNFKTGPGVEPFDFSIVPDLAEAIEVSNGGLTYTFPLRKGVKFHNVAPVSGREFDAEDVVASYARFSGLETASGAAIQGGVGSPSFGVSLQGVVDKVTAPDKSTVVFTLTKPNATFLNRLATFNFFWIYPKEAGVTYDPLEKAIGTGPWIISNVVESARLEYKKNPEYFEKGIPYMDAAVSYVLPERATQVSQFHAGAIHFYTPTNFGDFESLVSGNPDLRITSTGILGNTGGIGFASQDPNSPFIKDVRVRRAASLAIDGVEIIEGLNEIDKYHAMGFERAYRLPNFVPAHLNQYWIDPRGPEMGEAAQWFQYDPQKAKQLLAAAGYADGFEFDQRFSATSGLSYSAQPLLQGYWREAGLRSNLKQEEAAHFNPLSWHGEASGGVAVHTWQIFSDPAMELDYLFGPTSTRNQMMVNDPKFNAMQEANQAELDYNRRRAIIVEMLVYLGGEMRHVPYALGSIDTFSLHRPEVRNIMAYRSPDSQTLGPVGTNTKHYWLAS